MTARDRAIALDDWAHLHAADADLPGPWRCTHHRACTCPPPQPAEHCPTHGTYTPTTGLDADCPKCEDESARRDAEHDYRTSTPYHYR